jgi:hypothetical protein
MWSVRLKIRICLMQRDCMLKIYSPKGSTKRLQSTSVKPNVHLRRYSSNFYKSTPTKQEMGFKFI